MGDLDKADEYVVVARLGRAHGVYGWQHIQSFTEPFENVQRYGALYVWDQERWQLLPEVSWQQRKQQLLIKLPQVDSPEIARLWINRELAVPASALPVLDDPEEFYWRDLQGCQVVNQQEEVLGEVDQIMETGANDVLVIKGPDARQTLIPFTQPYIIEVSLEQHMIRVDWQADW